jgi:hypothetical protein
MIEQLTDFPDNIVAVICHGWVTTADYDAVLVPTVRHALQAHDKIRLYYETGADFTGFAPGAAWEDFKVGMTHLMRWERVAIVTDVEWIKNSALFFSLFMPIMTKVFSAADAAPAREWIRAS